MKGAEINISESCKFEMAKAIWEELPFNVIIPEGIWLKRKLRSQ